jgi:ATP-dependent Clp protease ATP-binding subunit ClpC
MFESEISRKMTLHAKKSLAESESIARHYGYAIILPEHLLFAIFLEEGSVGSNLLKNLALKRDHFNKFLLKKERLGQKKLQKTVAFSPALKSIITKAYSLASSFDYPYVGTEHLMYSLAESNDEIVGKILHKSTLVKKGGTVGEKEFETILQSLMNHDSLPHLSKLFDLPDTTLSKKSKSSSLIPYLDQFSVNLNEESLKRNEIVIGREKELERLIHILGRRTRTTPVLLVTQALEKLCS